MPSPSEKSATAGKSTFAAPKSAAQTAQPKTKNLDLLVIPVVVKHMTLKIYDHKFNGTDAGLTAQGAERAAKPAPRKSNFEEAFNMARGWLVTYRHLTPGSRNGPVGKITLTATGRRIESEHRREAGGDKKTKRFNLLYEKFLSPKPTSVPEKRGGA
jgi:hypothetical protein